MITFTILGFVAIVVFTFFSYKTAVEYRRSKLWALAVFLTGFFIQFFVPILTGVLIAVIMLLAGSSPEQITDLFGISIVVDLVCLVLSVIAMFLILRHIARFHDTDGDISEPPPPDEFRLS